MVVVHAMDFAVGRAQAVADRTIVCSLGSPRAGCFYLNWRASRAGCKLQARRGNCESYVDCPKGRMAGKARCCPSYWLFLMGSSWISPYSFLSCYFPGTSVCVAVSVVVSRWGYFKLKVPTFLWTSLGPRGNTVQTRIYCPRGFRPMFPGHPIFLAALLFRHYYQRAPHSHGYQTVIIKPGPRSHSSSDKEPFQSWAWIVLPRCPSNHRVLTGHCV